MNRAFIASAAFVALLVVVGVALAASGGGENHAPRAASVPARHAAPGRLVDNGGSRCGLPIGPTDKPVGPPVPVTWRPVGTVAVPSSPVFGPGIDRPGRERVCFAHSPTGALFAAANVLAMIATYGGDLSLMRDVLAETHARNVLLRQWAPKMSAPSERLQLAGFRVTVISRDLVWVDLAMRMNGGTAVAAITCPMRWEQRPGEGGDWRLMITDVDRPYAVGIVTNTTDYVDWSGGA